MEEILKQIKEAEKKGTKITEEAAMKKEDIIQKSRQDSIKFIKEKEVELDKDFKELIDSKTLELEKKTKDILDLAKKNSDLLEKKSKTKINSAIDYIMDRFEESLK